MLCVRCNHPISEHTGYGGSCMHRDKDKGPERGGRLCTCTYAIEPRLPLTKEQKDELGK